MTESLATLAPLPQGSGDKAYDNPGVLQGQVAPAPYIERYQIQLGSNLSPQAVSNVINFANIGYLWQLADLLDEVREMDAHLASVMSKRETAVAGADWDVVAENPKDVRAVGIAEWVKSELKSIRGLQHVFSHLMSGTYYGYAVCEQIWLPVNGKLRLVEVIPLHPRRFAFAALKDWRLYLWDQVGNDRQPRLGMFPGIALDEFPAGKFLTHQPRIRGGYPQREGLGRTLVWYSMMKRWAYRDWMALGEWAGRGLRIGTFNSGLVDGEDDKRATPEHVEQLRTTLNTFSSSAPAVIADTTTIQVLEMAHENRIHEMLIGSCDSQMSKVVLGNTLTTEIGSSGGNRAAANRQGDEQTMLAIADEKQLAESIRYGMIGPMVRYQFGPAAPVPVLHFAVAPEDSLLEAAQIIETLVDGGAEISQEYVYEKFHIPAPQPGQRVLLPKRATIRDQDSTDDDVAKPAVTDGQPQEKVVEE